MYSTEPEKKFSILVKDSEKYRKIVRSVEILKVHITELYRCKFNAMD
jgi:hypothetical protein